jgi:hypothetical protein
MSAHPLVNRTSPKGGEFIGTCAACGKTGLRMEDIKGECENLRNLSQEQAVIEAVAGKHGHRC